LPILLSYLHYIAVGETAQSEKHSGDVQEHRDPDGIQEHLEEEQVLDPHALPHPRTVMVLLIDANVTVLAVVGLAPDHHETLLAKSVSQ